MTTDLVERNKYMLERAKSGATYSSIGLDSGLSRERVRQILNKFDFQIPGYCRVSSWAKQHGYSRDYIAYLIREGKLDGIKMGKFWYVPISAEIKKDTTCEVCKKPLPPRKRLYCSPKCLNIGHYKSEARCQWRRLYRRQGLKIPPRLYPRYPKMARYPYKAELTEAK